MSIFSLREPSVWMHIAESQQVGTHVQRVVLSFDPAAKLSFPVGSHIQAMTWGCIPRCYSVAEVDDSSITITVSFSGGGAGSRFVATSPVGTKVEVFGPYDDYAYHRGTGRPKIFVAAGTGVAPFVRMVQEAIHEKLPSVLVLGVRTESDILYREYFEKIASAQKNFKHLFTLSRGEPSWQGARGYVTAQFSPEDARRFASSDVYVCGIPNMVSDTVREVRGFGTPKSQIFSEKYG
jgi:NAD(P)H-flavin reductase